MKSLTTIQATGRRKRAIAVVLMRKGTGNILINGKPALEYLQDRKALELIVTKPLIVTNTISQFDILARVYGGGIAGQAGAISLGISRAILNFDPNMKPILKKEGLLTRDPREKERKKFGLHRARRDRQYRKR